MMDAVFLHRLRALRLEFIAPKKEALRGWFELESLTSLRELDLSASRGHRAPHKDLRQNLLHALDSDQPALQGLERLILGRIASPEIIERINDLYPRVQIL
jgi:hypothetical protein